MVLNTDKHNNETVNVRTFAPIMQSEQSQAMYVTSELDKVKKPPQASDQVGGL